MTPAILALAAALPPRANGTAVFIAAGALIIAVVVAGAVVMHVRARLLKRREDHAAGAAWLEELREMHRRGEVSDDEFQAARASLLSSLSSALGPPAPQPTAKPAQPTRSPPSPEVRTATPGYDLTGAPLPTPINERPTDPQPPR